MLEGKEDEAPVVFLNAGDDRVFCVGCKLWVATDGFCEGDPDICAVGEEMTSQRSPSLDEAQQAITALVTEMREADEATAKQFEAFREVNASLQQENAELRSRLQEVERERDEARSKFREAGTLLRDLMELDDRTESARSRLERENADLWAKLGAILRAGNNILPPPPGGGSMGEPD